jgi:hypothetical protein
MIVDSHTRVVSYDPTRSNDENFWLSFEDIFAWLDENTEHAKKVFMVHHGIRSNIRVDFADDCEAMRFQLAWS